MSEKILFEHKISESEGFDAMMSPVPAPGPRTGQPISGATVPDGPNNGSTITTDIAQQAQEVLLAQNTISKSLPYMIGYTQPMSSSVGYVFALQQKDKTSIPTAPHNDDITVLRQFIETEVREVVLDLTNETADDIVALFGSHFPKNYDKFIKSNGELWDGPNGPLARFFLTMAHQRMTSKINKDFINWLEQVETKKGSATIASWQDMPEIIGIMAELREALFKNTGKSSQYWVLVSPKIAAFLSTYYGTQYNSAKMFQDQRKLPSGFENGYVTTVGDIDVYQYDFYKGTPEVTGGTGADSESTGKIIMGYRGGPGVSSVYYMPYNEYIVQGGEDYTTGQSNIFYKVRDTWTLNPLDTFDKNIVLPEILDTDIKANKSQYIVSAEVVFSTNLIS